MVPDRLPLETVLLAEAFGAEQRDEPARHRPEHRRALGAAYDELEPLRASATDRHDDPSTLGELLV